MMSKSNISWVQISRCTATYHIQERCEYGKKKKTNAVREISKLLPEKGLVDTEGRECGQKWREFNREYHITATAATASSCLSI
jgi:hypothetical protein